jgi:MFS family permease
LSSPVFRDYFIATSFATLGVWIARFLIGWSVWELTQSAFWVGATSAVMLAPTFLLSPIFGVISDRIDPRGGVVITALLNTLICVSIALLFFFDAINLIALLTSALAFGCVTAAHHPMRLALVPRILSRHLLPSGIGMTAMVFNVSRIIGPAIGAGIISVANLGIAYALAALCFCGTLSFLLKVPKVAPASRDRSISLLSDLMAGFRFIRQSPLVRLVLLMTLANGLVGRSVLELLPAISGQLTSGSAQNLAILSGVAGAGSIVGGLIVSRQRGDLAGISRLVMLALLVSSASLLPIVSLNSLGWLIGIITLCSLAMTVIGTGCQALVQMMIDDQYRGRVMSIWTVVSMGSPAIGALVIGGVSELLGLVPTLVGLAALALAFSLNLSRQRQRFRGI